MSVQGNMVGGTAPIKTLKIVDENNNEFLGVVTGSEVIFTATDNDVREGLVYASDGGVSTGSKFIPPYNTTAGVRVIPDGSTYEIPISDQGLNLYDYTNFQCIVNTFNTSITDSVATEKVVIEGEVYPVQSAISEATITKNDENKSIVFGITNNTGNTHILRFFLYKEIE